jgi:hypothetical protein
VAGTRGTIASRRVFPDLAREKESKLLILFVRQGAEASAAHLDQFDGATKFYLSLELTENRLSRGSIVAPVFLLALKANAG